MTATDAGQNESDPTQVIAPKDTIAPDAPTDLKVSTDGLELTGKAEPNSTITVYDANKNPIDTGKTDALGNFAATLSPAQTNGETLNVTAKDGSLNESRPSTVQAGDKTPPTELTAALNADGDIVTGKTEAGAKVVVKDAKGNEIGLTTAGADGSYTAKLSPALTDKAVGQVTAADASGNVNGPIQVIGTKDTIGPDLTATLDSDGVVVTGKTEPGAKVEIKDDNTVIGKATADANGNFTIKLNPAITDEKTVKVVAKDAFGNPSQEVLLKGYADILAPTVIAEIDQNTGLIVTGITKKNAFVEVRDSNNNLLGTSTAAPDGKFLIVLNNAQTKGQVLNVYATDPAFNKSIPATPKAPVLNSIIFDDESSSNNAQFNHYELDVKSTAVVLKNDIVKGNILINDVNLGHNVVLTHVVTTKISGETQILPLQNAGVLTINEKGEYSYTGIDRQDLGKTEIFSYTIADANDTSRIAHAELKITIGAEGIIIGTLDTGVITLNTGSDRVYATTANGQYISGDDIYVSRGANETIKSGSGNDTLIFNLLNSLDDTGGNGQDT